MGLNRTRHTKADENTAPAPRTLQTTADSTQYSLCLKACDSQSELSHNLHHVTEVINT